MLTVIYGTRGAVLSSFVSGMFTTWPLHYLGNFLYYTHHTVYVAGECLRTPRFGSLGKSARPQNTAFPVLFLRGHRHGGFVPKRNTRVYTIRFTCLPNNIWRWRHAE